MENNEDIIFDDMGGTLEEDSSGFYYTISYIQNHLKKLVVLVHLKVIKYIKMEDTN